MSPERPRPTRRSVKSPMTVKTGHSTLISYQPRCCSNAVPVCVLSLAFVFSNVLLHCCCARTRALFSPHKLVCSRGNTCRQCEIRMERKLLLKQCSVGVTGAPSCSGPTAMLSLTWPGAAGLCHLSMPSIGLRWETLRPPITDPILTFMVTASMGIIEMHAKGVEIIVFGMDVSSIAS